MKLKMYDRANLSGFSYLFGYRVRVTQGYIHEKSMGIEITFSTP